MPELVTSCRAASGMRALRECGSVAAGMAMDLLPKRSETVVQLDAKHDGLRLRQSRGKHVEMVGGTPCGVSQLSLVAADTHALFHGSGCPQNRALPDMMHGPVTRAPLPASNETNTLQLRWLAAGRAPK
jgi:hypothetical protein